MAIESTSGKLVKYLMVFFNILFFILGVVVMAFGIYALIKKGDFNAAFTVIKLGNSTWGNFGGLCIAVGVFIALLSGSGCYGAGKDSKGCLIFFSVLVGLVFILEVAAAGVGYSYRNNLNNRVRSGMNDTFAEYIWGNRSDKVVSNLVSSWESVQKDFKCCGINGVGDFALLSPQFIPPPSCNATLPNPTPGCYDRVYNIFSQHWKEWAGGVIGIAMVQLVAIIFSLLLVREIGKENNYTVV